MKYYLAYGSNLNLPQMRERCPYAVPMGITDLPDWRLVFRGRGSGFYLNVEPAPGCSVPAAVWSVDEADELALDIYEDYPKFYYKHPLPVTCREPESGRELRLDAFVYIMREGFQPGPPTEEYMEACLEGYKNFGFDPQLLWEAKAYSEELADIQEKSHS